MALPPLSKIAAYWETNGPLYAIDWNKDRWYSDKVMCCFGCGNEGYDGTDREGWPRSSSWIWRAHLVDRWAGGKDTVENLVPLCLRCHTYMPVFPRTEDRDRAIQWVLDCPPWSEVIACAGRQLFSMTNDPENKFFDEAGRVKQDALEESVDLFTALANKAFQRLHPNPGPAMPLMLGTLVGHKEQ